MPCNSLAPYLHDCGKYTKNGLNKIYMIGFHDLVNISGSTEVFATSVDGIVNQINKASGKSFVKVDQTKKTGGIKETTTINDNGSVDFTAEFTLSIDNFGAKNKAFTESLIGVPVVVLTQLKSGVWVAVGLDGNFELRSAEGTLDDANNNRALTFNGSIDGLIPEVDKTVVPALIALP
ncbi:hypothetical protein [Pedobacter agri]|uniref:hypothetical protein n=1 Tax=Pedobacter agri TaxID=454586 RepID=UPI00292D7293|nr:hypothetical protein [Pedobacter agri]